MHERLAIVLVGSVDGRLVPALRFLSTWGDAYEVVAVHVSVDPVSTRRLASDWMALDLSWLPLHVHDASSPSLPVSVVMAVRAELEACGCETCTVVIPRLDVPGRFQQLLHRGTGTQLARAVSAMAGITTLVAPVSPQFRSAAS